MITEDEKFMQRCLELAAQGLGSVQPNPMVGAVITVKGQIIGEGWHRKYGEAHAEINAFRSVKDPALLPQATLYVNLEPCSHYGKTPPCCDTVIRHQIQRVVIGTVDSNQKVNGEGIRRMRAAGIEVDIGIKAEECRQLNKRFFTFHEKQRPYIILKWAQTTDGFMDIERRQGSAHEYWITNQELKVLTHRWRSEEDAIVIGYNTWLNDHPQLTTREYPGKNPQRFIMTRKGSPLPEGFNELGNSAEEALQQLYEKKIQSVIIEGGRQTLDKFLRSGLWDEARVLTGNKQFGAGLAAPALPIPASEDLMVNGDKLSYYYHY